MFKRRVNGARRDRVYRASSACVACSDGSPLILSYICVVSMGRRWKVPGLPKYVSELRNSPNKFHYSNHYCGFSKNRKKSCTFLWSCLMLSSGCGHGYAQQRDSSSSRHVNTCAAVGQSASCSCRCVLYRDIPFVQEQRTSESGFHFSAAVISFWENNIGTLIVVHVKTWFLVISEHIPVSLLRKCNYYYKTDEFGHTLTS